MRNDLAQEELDLVKVRLVRAELYALIKEQTQDPAVLELVRDIGNQWMDHVASGKIPGIGACFDTQDDVRNYAAVFIRNWSILAEPQKLLASKLNWYERIAARILLRSRIKAHERLIEVARHL